MLCDSSSTTIELTSAGRHRVDHELRRVVDERDDVDALAGDLVRDRLYARAAHTDTRADRIDARIVAAYRDLRARARVAGRAEDVDQSLADLGHFELEELDQELGCRAAQEQLRATRFGAHVLEERLDAVLRAHRLARDHLVARDEAFGIAAEVDEDAVAVDALDDARDELTDARLVLVDDLRTLGLAHLLHDHLLRGLRGDAAERHRLERTLDETARLRIRRHVEPVLEPQLLFRELELGRIVREHLPAAERVVVAGLAVDRDADVVVLAVFLARSRSERCLERFEDDLLVDALLVGDGVHDHQDLFVHRASSRLAGLLKTPAPGAPCVRPRSARHGVARPPRPLSSSSTRRRAAPSAAAAVDRRDQLDVNLLTDETRELLRRPERPLESRRRHLELSTGPVTGPGHRALH
jgi:hypothetical protein